MDHGTMVYDVTFCFIKCDIINHCGKMWHHKPLCMVQRKKKNDKLRHSHKDRFYQRVDSSSQMRLSISFFPRKFMSQWWAIISKNFFWLCFPCRSPLSLSNVHLDKSCEPGEPMVGNHKVVHCKPKSMKNKIFHMPFWRAGGAQAKISTKLGRMGCAASWQNQNGPMKYFVLHGFGFAMDYFMISNHWFTWFTTFIQMDIRERGEASGILAGDFSVASLL